MFCRIVLVYLSPSTAVRFHGRIRRRAISPPDIARVLQRFEYFSLGLPRRHASFNSPLFLVLDSCSILQFPAVSLSLLAFFCGSSVILQLYLSGVHGSPFLARTYCSLSYLSETARVCTLSAPSYVFHLPPFAGVSQSQYCKAVTFLNNLVN